MRTRLFEDFLQMQSNRARLRICPLASTEPREVFGERRETKRPAAFGMLSTRSTLRKRRRCCALPTHSKTPSPCAVANSLENSEPPPLTL